MPKKLLKSYFQIQLFKVSSTFYIHISVDKIFFAECFYLNGIGFKLRPQLSVKLAKIVKFAIFVCKLD